MTWLWTVVIAGRKQGSRLACRTQYFVWHVMKFDGFVTKFISWAANRSDAEAATRNARRSDFSGLEKENPGDIRSGNANICDTAVYALR